MNQEEKLKEKLCKEQRKLNFIAPLVAILSIINLLLFLFKHVI